MSRKWVVIDFPILEGEGNSLLRLDLGKDDAYHAFIFSEKILVRIVSRLGVPETDIEIHKYNNGNAITAVINVTNMANALKGA